MASDLICCDREFSNRSALLSHQRSKKHKVLFQLRENLSIPNILQDIAAQIPRDSVSDLPANLGATGPGTAAAVTLSATGPGTDLRDMELTCVPTQAGPKPAMPAPAVPRPRRSSRSSVSMSSTEGFAQQTVANTSSPVPNTHKVTFTQSNFKQPFF